MGRARHVRRVLERMGARSGDAPHEKALQVGQDEVETADRCALLGNATGEACDRKEWTSREVQGILAAGVLSLATGGSCVKFQLPSVTR